MGPQFLWPFSAFSVDGVSWVEIGVELIKNARRNGELTNTEDQ